MGFRLMVQCGILLYKSVVMVDSRGAAAKGQISPVWVCRGHDGRPRFMHANSRHVAMVLLRIHNGDARSFHRRDFLCPKT